jgi:uncharacterized membrane protein SpoIIM required for sporulation/ABC-type transport system involved in multi-copper enzyme maturation permease subunit
MITWSLLRPSWIVARREMLDTFRDWRQVVPTLLLAFGFPLLMDLSVKQALDFVAQYGGEVMGERFVPFLLLMVGFFPVSASLYTALSAFAGEKEGRSLEPLLLTPLSDWQLYLGKFAGTLIPPLLAAYLGMGLYTLGLVWLANWHLPADILLLVMVLATVQAAVMVAIAIVVSSQTTSVRAASLLASFIILPVGALILAESLVIISATPEYLWGFVLALLLVGVLFIRMGIHLFDREELLVRDIDRLDLRRAWQVFWTRFMVSSTGRFGWYRITIRQVKAWRLPAALMVGAWVAALMVGNWLSKRYAFPAVMLADLPRLAAENVAALRRGALFASAFAGVILLQNLRVLLIQAVLGVFSFGVAAVLVFMLPWGLVGYLAGQFALAGYSPFAVLPFVLPHGLVELPALMLATVAMLYWGATTVAPPPGRSLFEVWLEAAADLARVLLGLVLPLLAMAAVLEASLTPAVIGWFFR